MLGAVTVTFVVRLTALTVRVCDVEKLFTTTVPKLARGVPVTVIAGAAAAGDEVIEISSNEILSRPPPVPVEI